MADKSLDVNTVDKLLKAESEANELLKAAY